MSEAERAQARRLTTEPEDVAVTRHSDEWYRERGLQPPPPEW